jgi:hypothetical protein
MRPTHTTITTLTFVSALIAILLAIYLYAPSTTTTTPTTTTQASKMATKPSMFNSNGTLPSFPFRPVYFPLSPSPSFDEQRIKLRSPSNGGGGGDRGGGEGGEGLSAAS